MIRRFCGLTLGLCLVMSTGLRAQDSLLLQIEAALNAPEEVNTGPISQYQEAAQEFPPLGRVAFSLNGAGAYIFGPMLHAELGLLPMLRFDMHVRFQKIAFLYNAQSYTYQVETPPSPGGGLIFCYDIKERHRGYVSLMGEYGYHQYRVWLTNDREDYYAYHLGIFGIGVGWRMRMPKGIFFNFGGNLFDAAGTEWYNSKYSGSYLRDWSSRPYKLKHPWFQVDVRVGIELWPPKK